MEYYKTNVRPWFGIFALLIIGIMMIAQPEMFNEVDPSGRKAFLKTIFSYIWGIPVGIIALILAGLLGYQQVKSQMKKD